MLKLETTKWILQNHKCLLEFTRTWFQNESRGMSLREGDSIQPLALIWDRLSIGQKWSELKDQLAQTHSKIQCNHSIKVTKNWKKLSLKSNSSKVYHSNLFRVRFKILKPKLLQRKDVLVNFSIHKTVSLYNRVHLIWPRNHLRNVLIKTGIMKEMNK
jgi:hypothetical protein